MVAQVVGDEQVALLKLGKALASYGGVVHTVMQVTRRDGHEPCMAKFRRVGIVLEGKLLPDASSIAVLLFDCGEVQTVELVEESLIQFGTLGP